MESRTRSKISNKEWNLLQKMRKDIKHIKYLKNEIYKIYNKK